MELSETVERLSKEISGLAPGPLAELRRMDVNGPGAAAYWILAGRCGFLNAPIEPWMRIVKIMAILTPRGEPDQRPATHDAKRRFGAALCDGGDSGWPGAETGQRHPFVSETRLARLIAQRHDQRPATLERLARMLARQRDPQTGINCIDIAALVLDSDNRAQLTALARQFYQRLDRANRSTAQQETDA